MSKFKDVLSAIGLAPKTLDQAKATLENTKPALDSVAALFSNAGLDLDAMLAAGPDSLKAHIDSFSAKDAELATAQGKVTELEGKLTAKDQEVVAANAKYSDLSSQLSSVGFNATATQDGKPIDLKISFNSHVEKQAALLLAKDGRPPVSQGNGHKADAATMTRAAFVALTPRDALAFVNNGGKITD